jgi:hypothetical protein
MTFRIVEQNVVAVTGKFSLAVLSLDGVSPSMATARWLRV